MIFPSTLFKKTDVSVCPPFSLKKNSSWIEAIPENEEKPRKFDALIETPKTNSGRLGNQVDTVGI